MVLPNHKEGIGNFGKGAVSVLAAQKNKSKTNSMNLSKSLHPEITGEILQELHVCIQRGVLETPHYILRQSKARLWRHFLKQFWGETLGGNSVCCSEGALRRGEYVSLLTPFWWETNSSSIVWINIPARASIWHHHFSARGVRRGRKKNEKRMPFIFQEESRSRPRHWPNWFIISAFSVVFQGKWHKASRSPRCQPLTRLGGTFTSFAGLPGNEVEGSVSPWPVGRQSPLVSQTERNRHSQDMRVGGDGGGAGGGTAAVRLMSQVLEDKLIIAHVYENIKI